MTDPAVLGRAPAATDTGRGLAPELERALLRVRLRARLRALWLKTFRAEAAGFEAIGFDEVDRVTTDADHPRAERAFYANDRHARAVMDQLHAVEVGQDADGASRLSELYRVFALSPEERNAIETCLALTLDPTLGRAFAWLQNDQRRSQVTAATTSATRRGTSRA